jgi:class 3 adenylate cyclase
MPADPRLAEVAAELEAHGVTAELFDSKWRLVFLTGEMVKTLRIPEEHFEPLHGLSPPRRNLEFGDYWSPDEESNLRWWSRMGPAMVHDVPASDPAFGEVFGPLADGVTGVRPEPASALTTIELRFPEGTRLSANWLGAVSFLYVRLRDDAGELFGIVALSRGGLPSTLMARLSRGDIAMFERMDRMRDPARRSAAILFADLEASGQLARRYSSRAYFELVRSLTDLIDTEVVQRDGVLGKHAGDGASALFVAESETGGEPAAALSAIEAARAIRAGVGALGERGANPVQVNVGLHWGATLTVGQVSTMGRLEVTALGDEMNEAARIESVATGGAVLASKPLIERLDPAGAARLGIDPAGLQYTSVAELGASEKAVRDAGGIPVTGI